MRTSTAFVVFLAVATCLTASAAAERSYPVDCLPDRVVEFDPMAANPLSLFGAAFVPGIFLGPPGDSQVFEGSFAVASLGFGGGVTVAFEDIVIEDRPGPDFIVFENAFFRLPLPESSADDFLIFAEPAIVEVSADGEHWFAFPYDAQALEDASGADVDRETFLQLGGLAGLTPTFTGNWTVPDVPGAFDPLGTAGVSGAGGDAFDLAVVGLAEARFVRFTDAGTENGFPGNSAGADLDAVVVLHGRPLSAGTSDRDGDRLPDLEELRLYGSDPDLEDTDGDGIDDGREVAGCRDPGSFSIEPWVHREPRIWLEQTPAGTDLRWTFVGTGVFYDLVRGEGASLAEAPPAVDVGLTTCVAGDATGLRAVDLESPDPAELWFYLVRVDGEPHLGRSSRLNPREDFTDCF